MSPFLLSSQMVLSSPCTKKSQELLLIPQHHSKLQPTEALLMVPFLISNVEKRRVSTGKTKLYKFTHPPPPSTQAGGAELAARWGLPKCFALYQPVSFPKRRTPPLESPGWDAQVQLSLLEARRSGTRRGLGAALRLPGQPRVAASRLCLGSPGRPGAGNRRRAGGPSGGIMGPDNRATDVTLPAICSPRQPCPPPPSPSEGSQGQSRAGGC